MNKWLCKLANNFLKKNDEIACETLMEIFKEKYSDKLFLIYQIEDHKNKKDSILLSNGLILDFSDYTISRIDQDYL